MRRCDKEALKVFKGFGLLDLLKETAREMPSAIIAEHKMAKLQPIYAAGSEEVKAVIDQFYYMALDASWGKIKAEGSR